MYFASVSDVENHKTCTEGAVQHPVVSYTQSVDWIAPIADTSQLSGAARPKVIEKTSNLLLYVPAAFPGLDGLQPAEGCSPVDKVKQPLPQYLSELLF